MLTSLQTFVVLGFGVITVSLTLEKTLCSNLPLMFLWLCLYAVSYPGAAYVLHMVIKIGRCIDLYFLLEWVSVFQLLFSKNKETPSSSAKMLQIREAFKDLKDKGILIKNYTLKKTKYAKYDLLTERLDIVSMIHRDFVKSWFTLLSSSGIWLKDSKGALDKISVNMCERVAKIDIKFIAQRAVMLYQEHVCDIQTAQQYLDRQPKYRRKGKSEASEFKKIRTLNDSFDKMGKFHVAVKENGKYEVLYVRSLCELVLSMLSPPELHKCEELRELVVDILTDSVLIHVVELMSQPHWVHKMIIKILSEDDPFQEPDECSPSHNSDELNQVSHAQLEDDFEEEERGIDCLTENFKEELQEISAECSSGVSVEECLSVESDHEESLRRCFSDSNINLIPPTTLSFSSTIGSLNAIPTTNESANVSSQFYLQSQQSQNFGSSGFSNLINASQNELRSTRNRDSNIVTANTDASLFYVNTAPSIDNENYTDNAQRSYPVRPLFYLDETERNAAIVSTQADNMSSGVYEHTPTSVIPFSGSPVTEGAPKLLFVNVIIPKTDVCLESKGNGRYVLYHIKYNAWHYNQIEQTWQSREDSVGRRYREFVTLHSRLDNNPVYKKHIKGITGPKKWLTLPFGSLEPKLIESRRIFLERYLQKLIKRQDICNSFAVREFLAYEGDARIAFVTKASDRIDKMIVRGMSDVFTRISNALPTIHPGAIARGSAGPEPRTRRAVDVSNWTDPHNISVHYENKQFVQEYTRGAEDILRDHIEQIEDLMIIDDTSTEVSEEDQDSSQGEFHDVIDIPVYQEIHVKDWDSIQPASGDESSLSSAVLDLAVVLYGDRRAWFNQKNTLIITNMLIGKLLERYFEEELNILATPGFFGFCLNQLKETIWPDGSLLEEDRTPISDKEKAKLRRECREAIISFLPGFLPCLVGSDDYSIFIDEIMKSMDNEIINRNFIFHIIDDLVQVLFPEIRIPDVQKQFIRSC